MPSRTRIVVTVGLWTRIVSRIVKQGPGLKNKKLLKKHTQS